MPLSNIVLRSLEPNSKPMARRIAQTEKGSLKGYDGFCCMLPIPFVKGSPADYSSMTVDELRAFIPFFYKSQYSKDLPQNATKSRDKVPRWWPPSVSFDRQLKSKGSCPKAEQQRHLVNLVKACYDAFGMLSLLAIGRELAESGRTKRYRIEACTEGNNKVVDCLGRTLLMVDSLTLTYDARKGDSRFYSKDEDRENKKVSPGETKKRSYPVRTTRAVSNGISTNPVVKKVQKKTTASKRKFIEVEDEPEGAFCKHCHRGFTCIEFCEEHEEICSKRVKPRSTQEDFMEALGMSSARLQGVHKDLQRNNSTSASNGGRSLRRLPARSQLLSIVKNNPIPLTSERGKQLIAEFNESVEHSFPPPYEKNCRPATGLRRPEGNFPTVTKRAITKDGENPHVYTNGKRQRVEHDVEMVIGVNKCNWKKLMGCKIPELVLHRLNPAKAKEYAAKYLRSKRSHLERQFKGALVLPKVKLIDFKRNKVPEVEKYLKKASKD